MRSSQPSQGGFALIEVLVSVLIFSLGVVGLVGVQARAIQVGLDAQDRNMAAMLANKLTGEMQAYKTTSVDTTDWNAEVQSALPNGSASVSAASATNADITITWQPPSRETPSQFTTKVVIAK